MKKCLQLAAMMFVICAVGFASADTVVISATGAEQSGGYDLNWRAAYLGAFEVGIGNANHNGTQIGGTFQNDGADRTGNFTYNAGSEFSLGTLQSAYGMADMASAFVYDNDKWPLGGANNSWANLTERYPDSYWIGSDDGSYYSGDLTTHEAGYYAYETTFFADEAYAFLTGHIATDNALLGVMINGVLIDDWQFLGTDGQESTTFDIAGLFEIGTEYIQVGADNTLVFFVNNHNDNANNYGNPAGIWVGDLQLTDNPPAVPEPASLLIFGLGMAGCVAFYRRKRQMKND